MADRDPVLPDLPESKRLAKKRTRISLVWVVPIVAAVIGAWVAVVTILSRGPTITIVLSTAEGLEAGKTKVRHNGIDVGTVSAIRLADDRKRVVATVAMAPKTEDLLVEDTRFWVVSPRISGASVTGLGTLLSGAYIGMDLGKSKERRREFEVLAVPPVITGDIPGRFFVLKSPDLGSIDYGTPVYFRRLQVGQISSYQLDKDGRSVTVRVFVNAPYDQFVSPDTRFWHASGIDMSLTASGVSLKTESVLSVLIGGLAFETPAIGPALPPAAAETVFQLYANRVEAFRPPPRQPQTYVLAFSQSVRGLAVGAPVDFRGIEVGQVEDIRAEADPKTSTFAILVTVSVDGLRFGVRALGPAMGKEELAAARRKLIDNLVARGLRAQLRTGSLVTGAMYVALDFFPDAPKFTVDWSQQPVRFATVPSSIEDLQANLAGIAKKLDEVPFKEIGEDLRKTLAELDRSLASARRTLDHVDASVGPDGGLNQELTNTIRELGQAARNLRSLTDYLERHPESLIRGKSEEAK